MIFKIFKSLPESENLLEQKACTQSSIIYFWDLLYSAVGNSSLSHAPRSKIRTTAEIPLKKGQKRPNVCMFYMLFL